MDIYIYIVHGLYIYIYIYTHIYREREKTSRFVGSKKPVTGLSFMVQRGITEEQGFIEFETSNSTLSAVFRQPLITARR